MPKIRQKGGVVASERIYLDKDGNVAKKKGDRAFLLAAEGQTIPADQAERLGIKGAKAEADAPEPTVVSEPPLEREANEVRVTGRDSRNDATAGNTGAEVTRATDARTTTTKPKKK